jgi:hypothetical protein
MEKNDKDNNNFRTLDGGSEKLNKQAVKKIPDTYAEVLSGDNKHPVKSGSSYDDISPAGITDAFSSTGGAGLPTEQIMDAMDSSTSLGNKGLRGESRNKAQK